MLGGADGAPHHRNDSSKRYPRISADSSFMHLLRATRSNPSNPSSETLSSHSNFRQTRPRVCLMIGSQIR